MNNRLLLIINRFLRSHFVFIMIRIFITFIKFIASIVKSIIIFSLLIFSNSVEIKVMRKYFEYKII